MRRRPASAFVRWLCLLVVLLAACATDDGDDPITPPEPTSRPYQQILDDALQRFAELEQRFADSHQVRAPKDIAERTQTLKQIERAKASRRETAEAKAVREARAKLAVERLAELRRAAEASALRSDVGVYRAEAEILAYREYLRELAKRAGLEAKIIPENTLRVLPRSVLQDLDQRWRRHEQQLLELEARGVTVHHGRDQVVAKRTLIREAIENSVDLVKQFDTAPRRDAISDSTWLAHQEAALEPLTVKHEVMLLQRALAIDGSDLQAATRLVSIDKTRPTAHAALRTATFERMRLLTLGPAVVEVLDGRITDPTRAAWIEAQLREHWRSVIAALDPPYQRDFTKWMVSHLSDADLVEVQQRYEITQRLVERSRVTTPGLLELRAVDLAMLEIEAQAVADEVVARAGGAKPLAKLDGGKFPALFADLPTRIREIPERLRGPFWEALEELRARAHVPADVVTLHEELAFEGYKAQAASLAKDVQTTQRIRAAFDDAHFVDIASWSREKLEPFARADAAITIRRQRLLDGLAKVRGVDPNAVVALREQIAAVPASVKVDPVDFNRWSMAFLSKLDTRGVLKIASVAEYKHSGPPRPFHDPLIESARVELAYSISPLVPEARRLERMARVRQLKIPHPALDHTVLRDSLERQKRWNIMTKRVPSWMRILRAAR